MNRFFSTVGLAVILTLCGWPLCVQAQDSYKLGVLAKRGATKTIDSWGPTADYLSARLAVKVELVPLKFTEIDPAVKNKQIDFLLANSAFYAEMQEKYGWRAITTMVNRKKQTAMYEFGGVIFARSDSPIRSLADVRGKKFMCVKYSSFGGAQMAWRLLLEKGIDPHKDCAAFLEGGTHDKVVMAVLNGAADVGTVRSDTLERMEEEGKIKMSDFKIINQIKDTFPFVHSTPLYPEWPLAVGPHVDPAQARKVAKALMLLGASDVPMKAAKVYKWTYPAKYGEVVQCLRRIGYGYFARN